MWRWRTTRGRRSPEDFAAEIRAHLDLEADQRIAEGREPDAARDAARRSFGPVLAAQERFHEARLLAWLDPIARDLQFAWRTLVRSPAFAATTVLTLAVALGLTTVVFTVFNAYVLRPFAVHDPFSLQEIAWRSQTAGGRTFTWSDYEELAARSDVFDGVIAERRRLVLYEGRSVTAAFVSGNYFEVLQPRILLGRGLARFDAPAQGREPVGVLSHQAWTRLFNRDPSIVGRTLALNGQPVTVVGVLRPEFIGLDEYPRDLWLPATLHTDLVHQDLVAAKQPHELVLTGRLRRNVTPEQAADALTPLVRRVVDKGDTVKAELRSQATPAPVTLEMLAVLSPVFTAFGLVLVAACANVSNVMLARANARHREVGVRLSLGASRGRVVRQLLTEGLLISLLSSAAALGLAILALRAGVAVLLATLPASLARLVRVVPLTLDIRVLAFALAVALLTTLMFALLPALHATRLSLTHALRGEASGGVGASRLRSLLVASQVAVSLVLIVVAATLSRNGSAIATTDLGFDTTGVISVNERGPGPSRLSRAADALAIDPHVGFAAVTSQNPLFGELPRMPLRGDVAASVVATTYQFVSPDYFPLLEIPILRGRAFDLDEARTEAPVGIISAAGARALWGTADPIGRTVRIRLMKPEANASEVRRLERIGGPEDEANTTAITIIGVAKDVVSTFVYTGKDPSHLYLPTSPGRAHAEALLVRGRSRHDLTSDAVQTVVQRVHENPQGFEVIPIDEMLGLQMYPLRAASWVGTTLGLIALILSVSGLYGVLIYSLSQRVREIGIRMALGASAAAVVRLVVRQSLRLACFGGVAGLLIAFGAMKALSAVIRLQNVSVVDAGAFTIAAVCVGCAVAVASYWPARRATRVDPASTLRADG